MAAVFPTITEESASTPIPFIDLVAQYERLSPEINAAVDRIFRRQSFVLGEPVAEFEAAAAEYCESRFAIGCASGTDALILSLLALDVGPDDEVITTPFTFFATAGAIHRVGAKPVYVDIEPSGFNINVDLVEAAITSRTKAIIPVHLFGQCAEMEPLWRLSVRSRIGIIEDACQAIGATYRGRNAGVLSRLGCFSFFPTKNLGGAGDGGLITTDDPELDTRLRRLRVHGDTGGYSHQEVGLNSRLDALQAAVLSVKLPHLNAWTEARQRNARRYAELFRRYNLLDVVELPSVLPDRRHVYNQYCVRIRGGLRDSVQDSLRVRSIGCAVYYPQPLHLQQCFAELGHKPGDFPEAEQASAEVLALPIYPELPSEAQERVVRGIAVALDRLESTSVTPASFPLQSRRAA